MCRQVGREDYTHTIKSRISILDGGGGGGGGKLDGFLFLEGGGGGGLGVRCCFLYSLWGSCVIMGRAFGLGGKLPLCPLPLAD